MARPRGFGAEIDDVRPRLERAIDVRRRSDYPGDGARGRECIAAVAERVRRYVANPHEKRSAFPDGRVDGGKKGFSLRQDPTETPGLE